MDLNAEIQKIAEFAKTQYLRPSEYARHNVWMGSLLLFFITLHLFLSFVIIITPAWLTVLLVLFNGYIMYYYFVTVVHEGSHAMIFYSTSKAIRKFIWKLTPSFAMLFGFPAFIIYWRDHEFHHNFLSTEKDPQNSQNLNIRKIPYFYLFRERPAFPWKEYWENTNFIAFFIALALKLVHLYFLFVLGGVFAVALGYVVPVIIAALLNGLRISFEHYRLYPNPKPLRSRSYTFLGSRIVAPGGLIYHFEHHLFQEVPGHRLKNIYRFIEENCSKELVNLVHYKKFRLKDFW